MQAVRSYWREKITSWEDWRYSLWSLLNPAAYAIRERLGLARHELKNLVHILPKAKVLELGCGSGLLSSAIASPAQYLGVDIAEQAIMRAKERFANAGNIKFLAQDILEFLEKNKESFDICVFLGVMDWFCESDNQKIFRLIPADQLIFSYTEARDLASKNHPYQRYREWHRNRQSEKYREMLSIFPIKHSRAEIEKIIDLNEWRIANSIPSKIPGNPSVLVCATRIRPGAGAPQ